MATIPYEKVKTPHDGSGFLYRWPNMAEGDVGQPLVAPHFNDKTVRAGGAFGGGAVILEGSLIPDSEADADFDQLKDPHDNPISFSLADCETVLQNVYLLRPKVVGGSTVDVDVYLLMR